MDVSGSVDMSKSSCLNMLISSQRILEEFLNFIFLDCHHGTKDPVVLLLAEIGRIQGSDPDMLLSQISFLMREEARFKDVISLEEVETFITAKFSSFLDSHTYYEICESSLELYNQVEGREDRLISLQKNFKVKSFEVVQDIMRSVDFSNYSHDRNDWFSSECSSAVIEEWFPHFISMVELLPVAISLIVNRKDKEYPIAYVNKAYEKMSGYSKREITSQSSMEYLRGGHKQMTAQTNYSWNNYIRNITPSKTNSSVNREKEQSLLKAIQCGFPLRVKDVTCYHKNGRPYQSVIAMRPLFTTHSEYIFTLCCQVNTSKIFNQNHLKVMTDILSAIPPVIYNHIHLYSAHSPRLLEMFDDYEENVICDGELNTMQIKSSLRTVLSSASLF